METQQDILATLVQHVLVGETREEALAILAGGKKDSEKKDGEKGKEETSTTTQRTTSRTP